MSIHYPKQGSESLKACGKRSCLLKSALGPNVRPLSLTLWAFASSTGKWTMRTSINHRTLRWKTKAILCFSKLPSIQKWDKYHLVLSNLCISVSEQYKVVLSYQKKQWHVLCLSFFWYATSRCNSDKILLISAKVYQTKKTGHM